MRKDDVGEAAPIVRRAMHSLLLTVSDRGRPGSDVRTAIGDLLVHVEAMLYADTIGPSLAECFDLTRKAGATFASLVEVRKAVSAEQPHTLGGHLITDSLIHFCLGTEARIIVDMTFVSREDAEQVKKAVNTGFSPAEETAADAMDSPTYMALIALHAATSYYLVETARPLPRMLAFQFAEPKSTLVAAHRLYDDAGRADELRDENKVVHPAFMRPTGRALSA